MPIDSRPRIKAAAALFDHREPEWPAAKKRSSRRQAAEETGAEDEQRADQEKHQVGDEYRRADRNVRAREVPHERAAEARNPDHARAMHRHDMQKKPGSIFSHCACASRMVRPNSIISRRMSPDTRSKRGRQRAAEPAGVWKLGPSWPGCRPMRGDGEFGLHVVMRDTAVFEDRMR